ncbi:MAG: hypothetical protein KDB52_11585 [Solirubrobacterales bacterium]|nr:hypothetical protein [Solirubrobacterales bacterium]
MTSEQTGNGAPRRIRWEHELLPVVLLAVCMVVSAAIVLNLTSKLTFITDEWSFLVLRQGWGLDQLLTPFGGHPVMTPAFIFKFSQELFGMDSSRPEQFVATAIFLLTNALLFIYLRRRVGSWAALIGTALILFLGGAFEALLWSFQTMVYIGAMAAGIGALIALDRDDHKGDVIAAILLALSLTFSGIGLTFVAAAIVEWALNPRDRRRRIFVPLVPLTFFVLWWLGWGHSTSADSFEPSLELSVLPKVPEYMFNAFAAGLTSLGGLATGDGSEPDQPHLIWGKLAAIVLIGLSIWRIRSLGRVPRDFLVTAAAGLCLYLMFALAQDAYQAFGVAQVRTPTLSRYQLPSAIFILLIASTLLRGVKIPRLALVIAGVLSLFAITNGIQLMTDKAHERWEPSSAYSKATLTGIEAAGPDMVAGYSFKLGTPFELPGDQYMRAVEAHGSPAYSQEELASMDPAFRGTADSALIGALGIEVSGAPPAFDSPQCRRVNVKRSLALEPGTYSVKNRGETDLYFGLARLGDPPGLPIGGALPGATVGLGLPAGSLDAPWVLSFSGTGPAQICSDR